MTKKMLIDAAHPEETRVVVVDGNRVEEFDFESQNRKQLRGNIYLAKITRVEPSLQAAFVEYGGNRHGFLAFNEIHPDYYQIPVADREALLREAAEEDDDHPPVKSRNRSSAVESENGEHDEDEAEGGSDHHDDDDDIQDEEVERRRRRLLRRYKIQEVIKRRQIMLVQVVKEERGNKGAALTTFVSLAGRYLVLMPNNPRGGGVSRRIEGEDREELKENLDQLEYPKGMSLIARTAGIGRSAPELQWDLNYMLKLWTAIDGASKVGKGAFLIYQESSLVIRAIRDYFTADIGEILIDTDDIFEQAQQFMNHVMPETANRVKRYRDDAPLFSRFQIEHQIETAFSRTVNLPSGGAIVIDHTEALVAIDVNSARSTRGADIEETAFRTNLEAADESTTAAGNAAAVDETCRTCITGKQREADVVALLLQFSTEFRVLFDGFTFALVALEPACFCHRGVESAPKRSFRKKKFLLEDGLIRAKCPNTMIIFYGMCLAVSLLFCGVIAFICALLTSTAAGARPMAMPISPAWARPSGWCSTTPCWIG